ncbi:MAG TPA: peptidase M28 family protein, partial [Bacteroidia bacterium]|nr:peptidase M28 family protein [Bacteroidia bacterium]
MKKISFLICCLLSIQHLLAGQEDSLMIRRIFSEALTKGESYQNLQVLCTNIGGRLSGSENAAKAVEYISSVMNRLNADSVYKQACMVPHWVRGAAAEAKILSTEKAVSLPVCALGGSIGTGAKGITAKIVEVHSFDELKKLGKEKLKG